MAEKGQAEKHFETEEDLTQIEIPPTLSREQIARGRSSAGGLNVGEDSLPAR